MQGEKNVPTQARMCVPPHGGEELHHLAAGESCSLYSQSDVFVLLSHSSVRPSVRPSAQPQNAIKINAQAQMLRRSAICCG